MRTMRGACDRAVGDRVAVVRRHDRLEDGDVQKLAFARVPAPMTSDQDAQGCVHAGRPVARASSDTERRSIRRTATAHSTAQGLKRELGRRALRPRTVEAKGADRSDDEMGERRPKCTWRERCMIAKRRVARPHDGVGVLHERVHPTNAPCVARIGNDAPVRGVQELEQRTVAARRDVRPGRRPPSKRVAIWWLHLGDIGTAITEQAGAIGAGDAHRQIDHAVPAQRPPRGVSGSMASHSCPRDAIEAVRASVLM